MADRSVVYRIMADIGNLRANMAQASASVKKFGNDVTAVGKEGDRLRRNLDGAARTAGRVGLVAAAGLGIMVARAADFEQAMSNVRAATHETETNMQSLRDAAIEFGASTQFSASEAAGAIENLAKAGVTTADILGGALKGSLDLAAAGQLPVAEAAEITATALTQFQLEGDQAAHVADLLAAGAGKAQGEVSDLANALKFAGVPAANLGVSIEETAGALALFAKNGIIGEQAGTSMRGLLASLTSPSQIAAREMENLGISMFDASGEFVGLAGVADQLQTHLSTLTEQERANALGRIFGNEQLQAANVLYREGAQGVQDWTRQVNDAGFAAETAAIKTDNLRGDLERLGGALDSALISGGSGSQGALRSLVQGLTKAVDAYNQLPSSAQNAATGLLAASAVVGGTIWVGAKLVNSVNDIREAMSNLGPAGQRGARGLALATKGVAALTIGLVAYNEASKAFNIGIKDDDIRRMTELLDASAGDDLAAKIRETSEALAEQKKLADDSFSVNVGVAKVYPFSQAAADAQDKVDGLEKHLADLKHQQDLQQISAKAAAETMRATTTTVVENGRAFEFTAEQVKAARDAYADARAEARNIGEAFFDLGENVDKAGVSLGRWIADLEKQARALEEFTSNAQKAARNGLAQGLIKELEEAGPAGALRMKQLADATDREIDRANRAWRRGQRAIDAYADATTKVPRPLRIEVDTSRATDRLNALIERLRALRSVQMEVRLGPATFAAGGPVTGPGTATSDSIPAYLSNGEYVIKAAAVAKYGVAMFDRMNAMHFAQGGHVGGGAASVGIDLDQLAQIIAAHSRGDTINVQPHNYNEFVREQQEHRARAGSDGVRLP